MAITVTTSAKSDGVVGLMEISYTGDGSTAAVIQCGFNPSWALVINETDATVWEKISAQAAANCLKTVTAGTTTVDTGSAVVFNGDGSVTLSATLGANGKAIKGIFRR